LASISTERPEGKGRPIGTYLPTAADGAGAQGQAGKAVFCEKPLAGSADEAHALWKAVEVTGAINMCAFMHRSIPALDLARDMIRSGDLGEIRHFRSRFLLNMLTGGPLNWWGRRPVPGPGASRPVALRAVGPSP
jgi:hypothetical protein